MDFILYLKDYSILQYRIRSSFSMGIWGILQWHCVVLRGIVLAPGQPCCRTGQDPGSSLAWRKTQYWCTGWCYTDLLYTSVHMFSFKFNSCFIVSKMPSDERWRFAVWGWTVATAKRDDVGPQIEPLWVSEQLRFAGRCCQVSDAMGADPKPRHGPRQPGVVVGIPRFTEVFSV